MPAFYFAALSRALGDGFRPSLLRAVKAAFVFGFAGFTLSIFGVFFGWLALGAIEALTSSRLIMLAVAILVIALAGGIYGFCMFSAHLVLESPRFDRDWLRLYIIGGSLVAPMTLALPLIPVGVIPLPISPQVLAPWIGPEFAERAYLGSLFALLPTLVTTVFLIAAWFLLRRERGTMSAAPR